MLTKRAIFAAAAICLHAWLVNVWQVNGWLAGLVAVGTVTGVWWLVRICAKSTTREVGFSQFKDLVDEEISPLLRRYGFAPTFKDSGRGYSAHFLRDNMKIVFAWDFQCPELECDIVQLPNGPDTAHDRLAAGSGPSLGSWISWIGAETLADPSLVHDLPPHIGNFPTAEDYRRGFRRWRELFEADAVRLIPVREG